MPSLSADLLLVFPAFLLGSAFGALFGLVLLPGPPSAKSIWPLVRRSMAGSAAGAIVFTLTSQWWDPIVGPFVACPAVSALTVVVFSHLSKDRKT